MTTTTPDGRMVVLEAQWGPWDMRRAADREWWKARVREAIAAPGGGIVAVEQILHAYGDTPDGALIDTKDAEAALVCLAYEAGAAPDQVLRIPAVSWRKDMGIQPPRTDPQVAIVVEWAYGANALANLDTASREHVYDALGLAVVAVARKMGRRIQIPANVAAAVYAEWQAAKAASKAKKQAKAAAEPVRRVLAAVGSGTMSLADLCRNAGMLPAAVVEALKVLGRGRNPVAAAARRTMVAAGMVKEKRPQTKQARERRSGAAKRGCGSASQPRQRRCRRR